MKRILKRRLFNKLTEDLASDLFVIITGARQVGKTTLLKQFRSYLQEKDQPALFVNLEDPDFLKLLNEHPKNIFNLFTLPKNKKVVFLVDEVQYLDNPTNFLKYLYDEYSDRIKIYVTSSSAFYLDAKFKDSLAGRKKIYTLNTLDFSEFLMFNGQQDLAEIVESIPYDHLTLASVPIVQKREILQQMNEYMTYGGYPKVVLTKNADDKREVLTDLIYSYIKKDILESGIKNDQKVPELLKILASQCGSLVNINNLAKVLRVSHTAIENYLFALRKSFILYFIPPFSRNIRNEIKKMPKVYFSDLGLRNVLLKDFRPLSLKQDKGQIFENFIFRQFLDRISIDDIKFWRNQQGEEIDFVLRESLACEVKYNAESISLGKYRQFRKNYPDIPLNFIFHEGRSLEESDDTYWQF